MPTPPTFSERFESALTELDEVRFLSRLTARDHTLWRPDPTEISNRLGWLDAVTWMRREAPGVSRFEREIAATGIRDAVLLGMGGSSLGAECLYRCLEPQGGLTLHVLDSTVPGWVRAVRRTIDPADTLFVVASKSGTTSEVAALFAYFWGEVEAVAERPGEHFAAITDPGTPLAELAQERDFRAAFLNPPDIGGRFSVLTYFGMVPAALAGADLDRLLAAAGRASRWVGNGGAAADVPALRLGALMAAGVRSGRPFLTLLLPDALSAFGLWAEQLLAESTGKAGTGVIPVASEPFTAVSDYRDDRVFVALRPSGGDPALDARLEAVQSAGHPLEVFELADPYALGEDLYRWEVATAAAGHLLGIHPFDQPDVEAAKARTRSLLDGYATAGHLPEVTVDHDLAVALAAERPAYLAILAYLTPGEEVEEGVTALRTVLLRRGVTTTFGYGPRYLHSTGQLHKGGPDGGLYLQLVEDAPQPLPIPGRGYGFETLVAAQADGDLRALQDRGRRTLRLGLGGDPGGVLRDLAAQLSRG